MQEVQLNPEGQESAQAAKFPKTLAECHATLASQVSKLEELAAQVSLLNARLKLDSRIERDVAHTRP